MAILNSEKFHKTVGFTPFKAQQTILDCKSDEIVVVAGRRFGKTALMADRFCRELLEPNKISWIVAPNYELTGRVMTQVVLWMEKLIGKDGFKYTKRPFPTLETFHKSVLLGKSADNPTSLLGAEVDFLGVDEASRLSKEIYEQYLFPVTQDRHAQTMFITTPTGKNWLYQRWLKTKEKFQFESRERPTFTDKMWEDAKERLPRAVFNQEFRGWFLEGAASVFFSKDIERAIGKTEGAPQRGRDYIVGVDIAKFQDFTVLVVLDRHTNQVKAIKRFNLVNYSLQKERIKAIAKEYNNAEVWIDSTGVGEPIYDDLFNEGVAIKDFKFSNPSKQKLVDKLRIMMEQGKIGIPNYEPLISELEAFAVTISDGGRMLYSAPEGQHDDCVMGLALAAWGSDVDIDPLTDVQRKIKERTKLKPKVSYI